MLVAVVLMGIWFASYAWSLVEPGSPAAYYGTLPRAWELATGALLAVGVPLLLRLPGMSALRAGDRRHGRDRRGGGVVRRRLCWPRTAAARGGDRRADRCGDGYAGRSSPVLEPLTWAPMVWVGDRSYSLYLWHWPVIILVVPALELGRVPAGLSRWRSPCLGRGVLPRRRDAVPQGAGPGLRGRPAIALWPVTVFAVVVCSRARIRVGQRRPRGTARGGAAVLRPASVGDASAISRWPRHAASSAVLAESIRLADAGAPIPAELVNEDGLNDDHWSSWFDCYARWEDVTVKLCPLGDRRAARTVVVYGDSQAGMLLPALDLVGGNRGLRVIGLVKLGCAPYAVDQWEHGQRYVACDEFRDWARAQIRELKPDVLVLGARGMWAIETNDGVPDQHAWSSGVDATLDEVVTEAGTVVVVSGIGAFTERPSSCLSDPRADLASCTSPEDERILIANDLTRTAAADHDLTYADLTSLACLRHTCPLVAERTVLYRDPAHLSKTWMLRVAWELATLMEMS